MPTEATPVPDASCVWVVDGGPVGPSLPDAPAPTLVIGVDAGAGHAMALGLRLDAVVGDFDSLDPATRAELERRGVTLHAHPADKDRSDLELALDLVANLEPARVHLLAGGGGRVDHLLTATLVVTRPRFASLELVLHLDGVRVRAHTAGSSGVLTAVPGETVSLLAIGGSASLDTEGFRWNLQPTTPLEAGSSLGLSNLVAAPNPRLNVTEGLVVSIEVGG